MKSATIPLEKFCTKTFTLRILLRHLIIANKRKIILKINIFIEQIDLPIRHILQLIIQIPLLGLEHRNSDILKVFYVKRLSNC